MARPSKVQIEYLQRKIHEQFLPMTSSLIAKQSLETTKAENKTADALGITAAAREMSKLALKYNELASRIEEILGCNHVISRPSPMNMWSLLRNADGASAFGVSLKESMDKLKTNIHLKMLTAHRESLYEQVLFAGDSKLLIDVLDNLEIAVSDAKRQLPASITR